MKLVVSDPSLSDDILRPPSTTLSIISVEKAEETSDALDIVAEAEEMNREFTGESQEILSNEATKISAWESVRRACRKLARTKTMEHAVLLMILGNCITLVMFDSEDRICINPACKKLKSFEILFSGMALFECIIRITGDGFQFYWKDSWNRMDFIIVCCGIIDFFPGIESSALSALRTTRVLRPLRVVNRFPSLRMLVRLLLDTIPLLGSVLVLCMFLFSAFGIMGVQLWKGVLRGGCYNDAGDLYKPPDGKYYVCSQGSGMKSCPPPVIPGYLHNAALYTTCNQTDLPNFQDGAISFDNIFVAFVAVFQVITLEDWSELMYALQDGYSYWVWPFFVLLILLGSWFATNLALVVIATQFKVTKKREAQIMIQEAETTGKAPPRSMWLECIRVLGSLFCCGDNACMNDDQEDIAKVKPTRAQFTKEMTDEERQDLKMIQDVFDLLDQDQDGSISVEELRDALQVLDSHLPKAELKALAESIDVDGDGLIDFEEFRVLMGYDASGPGTKGTGADLDASEIENGAGPNAIPKVSKIRALVQRIVAHKWFTGAVVICIAINTLSMAFEHHGQPDELTSFIEITNAIFAFVFLFEVMLRVVSVGAKVYLLNGFNVCDAIIVFLGVVEVFANSGNLIALRSFRLLRLFKLARYLPTMQKQLTVMLKSLDSVMTFLLLLSLFIFMFAIMGMHLFGGRLADKENMSYTGATTRGSFDDFPKSVISVFQVLTTEEWNIMMYHAMHSTNFSASLYFITLIVFGTYILVNLFVAIMVEGFATDPEAIERFKAAVERARALFNISDTEQEEEIEALEDVQDNEVGALFETQNALDQNVQSSDCCLQPVCCFGTPQNKVGDILHDSHSSHPSMPNIDDDNDVDGDNAAQMIADGVEEAEEDGDDADTLVEGEEKQLDSVPPSAKTVQDRSTQSFKRKSKKKRCSKLILNSRACHWVILIFLTFDAVLLCIERPAIDENSNERLFLEIADFICEFIFTAEALLKIATVGFFRGPDAYMKSVWNIFDFTLLLSSWPRLILEVLKLHTPAADAASRVFRIYRTVRPFRIIPRVPPVKQTMHMLYVSVRPVGNLLLVGSVFYIIFAILGVQMFKGKLYWCDTDLVNTELPTVCEAIDGVYNTSSAMCDVAAYNVLDKTDCMLSGGIWQRRQYNFDNVAEAVLTLFVVSSRDGWIEIMHNGMDVVGVDMQPQEYSNNLQAVIFFISFLLIVGYFVISMFVGVIVENFQLSMPPVDAIEVGNEAEGDGRTSSSSSHIDEGDGVCYDEDGLPIIIFPDGNHRKYRLQRWALNIVNHKYFDHAMAIAIFVNVLIMGCEHLGQSDAVSLFLDASNYIFTGIYVLEMIIKIVAAGPFEYFKGSWNRFDAFVAITSLIGCSLSGDGALSNSSSLQAVRIMRVARILKLMKVATGLSSLLTTVWSSMPQVMCMGLILLILFISASALGIELFGKIPHNSTSPSTGISTHANFENAALAGLTLFRIATGDNWVGIMRDTLASDLPRAPVVVYYIFFVVTAQFVLLNVVVAVLMKNLTAALQWVDVETGELVDKEGDCSDSLGGTNQAVADIEGLAIAPSTSTKFKVRPAIAAIDENEDISMLNNDVNNGAKKDVTDDGDGGRSGAISAIVEVTDTQKGDSNSRDTVSPTLPVRSGSLQLVDFNHERFSDANDAPFVPTARIESTDPVHSQKNGSFLHPPEHLLENLQERTARLSMRSQVAPTLRGKVSLVQGESRNKRALKASLHLVMAMVKMSGTTDISKPKDGSRPVRLSIRNHVMSNGRPSMRSSVRHSVNSLSSVRSSVHNRGASRSSMRLSLITRQSIKSHRSPSVRTSVNSHASLRGSLSTRPSVKTHHRHSINNCSTNRGSLRTSFATREHPGLIDEGVLEKNVIPSVN